VPPDPETLYLLKYHDNSWPLVRLELRARFGFDPDAGRRMYLLNREPQDVTHSACIEKAVELIARAPDIPALGAFLSRILPRVEDAMVELRSIGHEPSPSTPDLYQLLPFIKGSFELKHPKIRFLLTRTRDEWLFGRIVSEASKKWTLHSRKPKTFSSALEAQFARFCLNALAPHGKELLDAGCGSGSVLVEAADMGFRATGIDLQASAIGMARANLEHFGYIADLKIADVREWKQSTELAFVDFPYGYRCARDRDGEIAMARALATITGKAAIFICGEEMSADIREAGWDILDAATMPFVNVTRHVLLATPRR
jgi:predicted RNA methylase